MNFWDRVTGGDMDRELKAFEVRAKKLPAEYQTAWEDIKTNLWPHSDFSGRNLMPVLDGALGMLEESAAEGLPIGEVLDGDIPGFCAALVGKSEPNAYRDKWRCQLNDAVAKKLAALNPGQTGEEP